MNEVLDLIGSVIMFLGALVFLVGALGMLRLPDLYSRLNAVTVSGASGIALVLLGLFLHVPSVSNAVKLGMALVIQLATASVGGSAMARAGYLTGAPQARSTQFDDLAVEERSHDPSHEHPGHSPFGD